MKDGIDGQEIEPLLTFLENHDEILQVNILDFATNRTFKRGIPVKYVELENGSKIPVTTVYDLLMAQFGSPEASSGTIPKTTTTIPFPSPRPGRRSSPALIARPSFSLLENGRRPPRKLKADA